MGLTNWIMGIGIRLEQTAHQIGVRGGAVPIQWPAGLTGSLIYRLPRDPAQRASIFSTNQTIIVNEGETAVVLEDGQTGGALEPGRYVFQKARVTGALDIVWVRTGQQALKWGIGNVSSSDGIQISTNGVIYVRVIEGTAFNSEVIQGALTLPEIDIQRFLMPRIQGVVRQVITSWEALELQAQREAFVEAVKGSLSTTFSTLGLGIVDFEVVEVNFPPEFKAIIAQAAMATHQGKASLIEAQNQAQIRQIEAIAEANAQLTAGTAQVQVMAQLQAQGIDPLKLKALEAVQTMAENPVQGTVVGGDPRVMMMGQIAAPALAPGVPVNPQPTQPIGLLPGASPAGGVATVVAAPEPVAVAAAPPSAGAPDPARGTVEYYEAQIEKLDDRVAEGSISEEFYEKQVARIEAKIAKLQG